MIAIKQFDELTTRELHDIYRLRIAVFVVEQKCYYQDVDEIDPISYHLQIIDEGQLAAYCRIYTVRQDDHSRQTVKIGRVCVARAYRHIGLGKQLLKSAISFIEEKYPNARIEIQAQNYLTKFYESFGFTAISEIYLEDEIPHIDMELV